MEEAVPDVTVNEDLADSVLRSSLERLDEEISERADRVIAGLTENELREFRGVLATRLVEEQRDGEITVEERIDTLKTEETHWRDLAKRQVSPRKKLLYESIADVAALKADELRLRVNVRPESELAQNIIEEDSEANNLTKLERFKNWAKRNLGGISIVAISVAVIITTIVTGMQNAVKKGAQATSKFAKALAKVGEKAAPVLGGLLNLAAKLLTLAGNGIGFLAKKPFAIRY